MDETGFLKKGTKPASVQRQCSGSTAARRGGSTTVRFPYSWPMPAPRGGPLLDRELYLPQIWSEDWSRRREAGVPEDVGFQTKPKLARRMLERALESGVSFAWIAGEEVYGTDRNLQPLLGGGDPDRGR